MAENLENKPGQSEETSQDTSSAELQVQEEISLSDAMTGVFTEPGTTFGGVKNSKKRSYWVVPTIILIVFTLVASFLVLNDEELYSEIKTMQTEAAKKRMEQSVKEGKMTQEQMNEAMERTEKFMDKSSPFFLVSAIAGPIIGTFVVLFFRGLVLWGAVKVLKGTASYMLVICVVALTGLIDVISTVINTVLSIVMGRLSVNIGPALFATKDTVGESLAKFLAHFDLINIWYLIVLGIGLGVVSNLKSSKTIPAVFVLWLIWIVIASFAGISFIR
jgi:Yip1 domain